MARLTIWRDLRFGGCDGSGLFGWRGIGGFHEPIGAIISPSTPETGVFFDLTLQQSPWSTADTDELGIPCKRFQFFLIVITTYIHTSSPIYVGII